MNNSKSATTISMIALAGTVNGCREFDYFKPVTIKLLLFVEHAIFGILISWERDTQRERESSASNSSENYVAKTLIDA